MANSMCYLDRHAKRIHDNTLPMSHYLNRANFSGSQSSRLKDASSAGHKGQDSGMGVLVPVAANIRHLATNFLLFI